MSNYPTINYPKDVRFMKFAENSNIVYFLLREDPDGVYEMVYVGQSHNGFGRVYQHRDKEFTKVMYVCVPDGNCLDVVEAYYIGLYQPKLNARYNESMSMSLVQAKNMINRAIDTKMTKKDIKQIIVDRRIHHKVKSNGEWMINPVDIKPIALSVWNRFGIGEESYGTSF